MPSTTSIANIIQQQQLQQSQAHNQTIIAQPVTNNIQSSTQLQPNNNLQVTQVVQSQVSSNNSSHVNPTQQVTTVSAPAPAKKQKKKKKKPPKERKPRLKPGEVRLTSALDGSTLYECPDCQVCYPERGILEQHMVGHNLERKFVCDVCNAGLKRKDHVCQFFNFLSIYVHILTHINFFSVDSS